MLKINFFYKSSEYLDFMLDIFLLKLFYLKELDIFLNYYDLIKGSLYKLLKLILIFF
jgi:hypothetical protein